MIPGATKYRVSGPASTALLHFDGTNGGTTFTDDKGHTFSIRGGSPVTSTAQFKFGSASLSIPNVDSIKSVASADWQFTADFTVDFRIYLPDTTTNRDLIGFGGFGLSALSTGVFSIYKSGANNGGSQIATTWMHIALVRSGTAVVLYVDGTSAVTLTSAVTWGDNTTDLTIPTFPILGYQGHGLYMDELRIIKGTAAWTANFTPPTSAYTN